MSCDKSFPASLIDGECLSSAAESAKEAASRLYDSVMGKDNASTVPDHSVYSSTGTVASDGGAPPAKGVETDSRASASKLLKDIGVDDTPRTPTATPAMDKFKMPLVKEPVHGEYLQMKSPFDTKTIAVLKHAAGAVDASITNNVVKSASVHELPAAPSHLLAIKPDFEILPGGSIPERNHPLPDPSLQVLEQPQLPFRTPSHDLVRPHPKM